MRSTVRSEYRLRPFALAGWLHCYSDPLLAVLLNPIHGNYDNPRLFEAEIEGSAQEKKLTAGTEKRPLKAVMGALEAVALDTLAWHRKAGTLVRRDEVRSKVYMAASEAFDEMLARLKTTGLHLLEPEVIHSGTNYAGHLKMYAEDAGKRPYALALDCVGDYKESKITIHFFAESAELVMALREKVLAALAGKE